MINVGLIGCGDISHVHMGVYKRLKNVKVIGVCDIVPEKVKILADMWGVDKCFTDYRDLLEVKDLDMIDICTPTSTHTSIAIDVAKSGRHILLEKPMAPSTLECDHIIEESRKKGVSTCINHHALFFPSIKKAKSLVDSGYYDLQSFEVFFKSSAKTLPDWCLKLENGELLWEVGTHMAYLELFFLPNVKEVYATGNKSNGRLVYDNFAVLLRTSDDSFGVMDCSLTSSQREFLCEITSTDGNRGKIDLRHDSFMDKSRYDLKWFFEFYYDGVDFLRTWIKSIFRNLVHYRNFELINSKLLLMGNYIKSIENDLPPPVTPEQGRDTIKLLECIKRSLETHSVIPVH